MQEYYYCFLYTGIGDVKSGWCSAALHVGAGRAAAYSQSCYVTTSIYHFDFSTVGIPVFTSSKKDVRNIDLLKS